ncbi:MAG: hypothetical protein K8M05_23555 [Deltaproteobacteria bacterium]|nr:hypothetical protein [Kofleriaceae bacterium]
MRRCLLLTGAALALGAAACDDYESIDGARGPCASGGTLAGCEDSERTAAAACWRLVECGAIPLEARNDDGSDDPNVFDFGRCLNRLETLVEERARVVIACVSSSTCDELWSPGSPDNTYVEPLCFQYGDR